MTVESNLLMGEHVADGQVLRLLNSVIDAAGRLATLEVVAMGRKMGLSLATLTESINLSTAASHISQVVLPSIVAGNASTDIPLRLMLEDVDEAISLGMRSGTPMPIASIARGLLQVGVNTLGERARGDDAVVLIESMAGTRLRDDPDSVSTTISTIPPADATKPSVGYVGLGAMGAALARRLLLSHKIHVFDVRPQAVRELETEGAIAATDLLSLARTCDVIMICVPTSGVVREVLFGKAGLAQGLSPGKTIVDQTTGDPEATRSMAAELQELGVALLDAPVSGGPAGALAGTIATMCSGPTDAYARLRGVLGSISPNVVYCGPTGNAHIVKLVKNAVGACNRLITYEAVAMGVKNKLKLEDIANAVNQNSGWSKTFERILPALASGVETAKLRLELMVKDLALASSLGMSCGAPMLIANAVRSTVEAASNELGGDANIDELARVFEARAGIKFADARAHEHIHTRGIR
jgi:3-hydroxyisobutyrate dehydrogenase